MKIEANYKIELVALLTTLQTRYELDTKKLSIGMFDKREVHHNCMVEILTNSVTGEVSVGWKEEEGDDEDDGSSVE